MSKSILVIDTPETCFDCRFCRELHEGMEACCEISDEPDDIELCRMIEADYCQEKPAWCPLRDLPEKYYPVSMNFESGFNACIDEILKGVNGNERSTD